MRNSTSNIIKTKDREAFQRSARIDRIIERDAKLLEIDYKVLLLGLGESGKSTIVKKMKIAEGFSPAERIAYRAIIYRNLWESAQVVTFAMHKLFIEPAQAQNHKIAKEIAHYELDLSSIGHDFRFPQQLASSIDRLRRDPVIPQLMDCLSSEFSFASSADYFFTQALRIGSADYVPSDADILRCWQKNTGIVETKFNMPDLRISVLDVGDQCFRRRKWIRCFENIPNIFFCTALSEYDQESPGEKNHVAESLALFDAVVNSHWFRQTPVLLFFNKVDEFRHKLRRVPLDRYFPEYTGGANFGEATRYMSWKFAQANRARVDLFTHLTQENDTFNIRIAFSVIKTTIIQNHLRVNDIL